jgi:hypothetical protein
MGTGRCSREHDRMGGDASSGRVLPSHHDILVSLPSDIPRQNSRSQMALISGINFASASSPAIISDASLKSTYSLRHRLRLANLVPPHNCHQGEAQTEQVQN